MPQPRNRWKGHFAGFQGAKPIVEALFALRLLDGLGEAVVH